MDTLKGQIEKVIYRNEENGYTVGLIRDEAKQKSFIIVGNIVSIKEGEFAIVEGMLEFNPKHKRDQLKISSYTPSMPTGVKGIEAYLASGFIKGIGPELATRIVNKFGINTIDIIEHDIQQLLKVNGIGKKKLEVISESWDGQKRIRDLVFFLQDHDISGSFATKVYALYGDKSIETITANPYVLVRDIRGVGFVTADKIAAKLGFPKDSVFRAEAAVYHSLLKAADEGHNYYPIEELVQSANNLIHVAEDLIYKGINGLEDANKIVIDSTFGQERVYLRSYFKYEKDAAKFLNTLITTPKKIPAIDVDNETALVEKRGNIELADEQRDAIRAALMDKVVVITGGPGVGKTTIINSILKIYNSNELGTVLLAAPTGKAAKRMSEVTGMESVTIHRLLEYSPQFGGFQRSAVNPLACDMVICDEASMIDIYLFYSLVSAIPRHATFVLVGDVNQLPSVGVGNVLNDVINSGKASVVRLNKIFRQAEQSLIIVNSHKVNAGEFPTLDPKGDRTDFFYVERDDAHEIKDLIIELVTERIPKRFNFDPMNDIQVLAPMYKGDTGINVLNTDLQKKLNKNRTGYLRNGVMYAVNDKVMQIKNNYDKEVFNGDIGIIKSILHDDKSLFIDFDGRLVPYEFGDMDEVVLAYATSVHKSQGSEYPAVVIPLTMQHYMLLQRNLLYTGITRGKKLVVLVGEKKALAMAIKNNKTRHRYTSLAEWLTGETNAKSVDVG